MHAYVRAHRSDQSLHTCMCVLQCMHACKAMTKVVTHCVGAVSAAVERGRGRKPVARSCRRDEERKDDGE
jgi:hypothetical protein